MHSLHFLNNGLYGGGRNKQLSLQFEIKETHISKIWLTVILWHITGCTSSWDVFNCVFWIMCAGNVIWGLSHPVHVINIRGACVVLSTHMRGKRWLFCKNMLTTSHWTWYRPAFWNVIFQVRRQLFHCVKMAGTHRKSTFHICNDSFNSSRCRCIVYSIKMPPERWVGRKCLPTVGGLTFEETPWLIPVYSAMQYIAF